jgi:hypothetical protein
VIEGFVVIVVVIVVVVVVVIINYFYMPALAAEIPICSCCLVELTSSYLRVN